jgi:hypothetical protein
MTIPNSYIAFPFLSVTNGVAQFWISADETLDISIADLGLASVASIVMFENDSTITLEPGTINYDWFVTATPDSADIVLYSDVSDGGITKKTTITNLISGAVAPVDATYVTLTTNATLTNESVLAAGSGLTLSTSTFSVDFTSVQAKDATLTSIALLGTAANKMLYTTGIDTWAEADITAAGRALLDDATASDQRTTLGLGTIATQSAASVSISGGSITGITDIAVVDGGTGASDAATARTNLGVVIGTDVQAYDGELAAIAGLTSAADKGIQFTGAGTAATYDLTAAGKALLDDVDASAQRTTLGLGTLATQSGTFSGTSSGTNTGDQNLFSTIAVSGQSDVVADTTSDTLTLAAGANVTITTNAGTDTITIASSGGGGLSDSDYGDITVSGGGTVMTIDNDVVTYAKMQNVSATDKLLGRSSGGAGDVEEIACTTAGRALIDDADASAQRTTLGLGTIATQAANSVSITGGSVTGITDIAIADGGTGASTATAAFNALSPLTTQGDVLYHNGTDVVRLAAGTNGHYLQTQGAGANPQWAAVSGGSLPSIVVKSADESVTSSTALQDDDTLQFSMSANTTYFIVIEVLAQSTSASPDFSWDLAGPASPSSVSGAYVATILDGGSAFSVDSGAITAYNTQVDAILGATNWDYRLVIRIKIANGANSGTFKFRWAQRVSNATATIVKAGSHLTYQS